MKSLSELFTVPVTLFLLLKKAHVSFEWTVRKQEKILVPHRARQNGDHSLAPAVAVGVQC